VPVLDVVLEAGGGGAGHVAHRALVLVHVVAEVVAQQALRGTALVAVRAHVHRHVLLPVHGNRLLPLEVIVEFGSIREQSSARRTRDQLLLCVTAEVFAEFVLAADHGAAADPFALTPPLDVVPVGTVVGVVVHVAVVVLRVVEHRAAHRPATLKEKKMKKTGNRGQARGRSGPKLLPREPDFSLFLPKRRLGSLPLQKMYFFCNQTYYLIYMYQLNVLCKHNLSYSATFNWIDLILSCNLNTFKYMKFPWSRHFSHCGWKQKSLA
jgi:hypothetical protein